jgi:hypothetical protein
MTVTIAQPAPPAPLGADGFPSICEQGSAADLEAKALMFLSCPQGANPYDPEFGLPAQLFGAVPVNTTAINAALAAYMPELLNVSITQAYDPNGVINGVIDSVLLPNDSLLPSDDLLPGGSTEFETSGSVNIGITGFTAGS